MLILTIFFIKFQLFACLAATLSTVTVNSPTSASELFFRYTSVSFIVVAILEIL